MITTRQLERAFIRHDLEIASALADMRDGNDLELMTKKALDSALTFIAIVVSFREQEENREHACDRCPCQGYDGRRLEAGYWTDCSCKHIAQDHNVKEPT